MLNAQQVQQAKEVFSEYLKGKGLKKTRQRDLVLEAFLKSGGHPSVEDLHSVIRKKNPGLGFVTVYRTVKELVNCGLAREVNLGDGRSRFEHFFQRPHHHHLVCMNCNRTIEFLSPEIERLQEQILKEYKFKSLYHHMQVYGICDDCQNKRRPSRPVKPDSTEVFARDVLQLAMGFERNGLSFYQAAATQTKNPAGKKIFLSIADEEQEHLSELEKEYKELLAHFPGLQDTPPFLVLDRSKLPEIFPVGDNVRKFVDHETGDLQALTIAMRLEKRSHEFFKKYAEEFTESKGKNIFLTFAEEEKEHFERLQQQYDRLVNKA